MDCRTRSGSSSAWASRSSSLLSVACSWCATSAVAILERLPLPHRVVELYDRFEEGVFSVDRRTAPDRRRSSRSLIWTTEAMRLLLRRQALGFDIHIGISGAFFVALIASLLTAVPFTPAGLGIVEGGIVGILTVIYGCRCHRGRLDRGRRPGDQRALGRSSSACIAYMLSPKTKGQPDRTADDRQGVRGHDRPEG